MDERLISAWNGLVQDRDEIYHLGDFSFHNSARTANIVDSLKGKIHLIAGNHDNKNLRNLHNIKSVENYKRLRWEKQRLILCHYPFRVWNGSHEGAWHLHGHCHGNLDQAPHRIYDVGVDNNYYRPIHIEELSKRMKKITNFPKEDHHR